MKIFYHIEGVKRPLVVSGVILFFTQNNFASHLLLDSHPVIQNVAATL